MTEMYILASQIRLPYRYAVGRWYGAFLEGLPAGRLVGSRCGVCLKVALPARGACPLCGEASAELTLTGPEGQVVAAAVDNRDGGLPWLLVRADGADTNLLVHGRAEIGARVRPEFDAAAGPSIAALKGFRQV